MNAHGWSPIDVAAACRRAFGGLEPHQARYLLETFTGPSICEDFLLFLPQVSRWRRLLGCKPMPTGPRRLNSSPGTSPNLPSPLLASRFR